MTATHQPLYRSSTGINTYAESMMGLSAEVKCETQAFFMKKYKSLKKTLLSALVKENSSL